MCFSFEKLFIDVFYIIFSSFHYFTAAAPPPLFPPFFSISDNILNKNHNRTYYDMARAWVVSGYPKHTLYLFWPKVQLLFRQESEHIYSESSTWLSFLNIFNNPLKERKTTVQVLCNCYFI